VTHGLNNKPAVMDQLIAELVGAGFDCYRVSLFCGSGSEPAPVIAERWMENIAEAYGLARQDKYQAEHVSAVAYSLGALATLWYFLISKTQVGRLALLAPPLVLSQLADIVRHIAPLAPPGLALPSLAPVSVRARSYTPLNEYQAMLDLARHATEGPVAQALGCIPTRVFLSQDDELVSYRGVKKWIERRDLPAWDVVRVPTRPRTASGAAHLMVAEEALGSVAWSELVRQVITHLSSGVTDSQAVSG
jgi:pimeloyl-ACP methyl ester carboxylesterase